MPIENQLINDINLASEEAERINAGFDEAEQLGIRSMASEIIEAHGRRYMVADALIQCPEFGEMIRSTTESLKDAGVDAAVRQTVVESQIKNMVAKAAKAPVPEAVKEGVAAEKAAQENVKKK